METLYSDQIIIGVLLFSGKDVFSNLKEEDPELFKKEFEKVKECLNKAIEI